MIKFENMQVMGWEPSIRGMRNPKRSHAKSDSLFDIHVNPNYRDVDTLKPDPAVGNNVLGEECYAPGEYYECASELDVFIGNNDHDLMMRLSKAGSDHRKYMRMIDVYVDITAPLYWWKEFDTYRVGVEKNSDSTMHMIHEKEFTLDDFSHEHLIEYADIRKERFDIPGIDHLCCVWDEEGCGINCPSDILDFIIEMLNKARKLYNQACEKLKRTDLTEAERKHVQAQTKVFWWQMIQLLPSSYNQKRTVKMSYEALANMYKARKNHKLDEWRTFCAWVEELPCSEIIIGGYLDEELVGKLSEVKTISESELQELVNQVINNKKEE